MSKWKARLEMWNKGEKVTSRWTEILFWFLQGDITHLLDISVIPVCKLLQQSKGYRMREPENRNVSGTHSLFVEDLKHY